MALLDDAAEKYARPKSVTFTMTIYRDSRTMRAFVCDVHGEVVCIDSFLASGSRTMREAFREQRGFLIPQSQNPATVLWRSLEAIFGPEVARTIMIREVR